MQLAIVLTFYNWEMSGTTSYDAVGDSLLCTQLEDGGTKS